MRIHEYQVIDRTDTEAAEQLKELANSHPHRAARLMDVLEEFVQMDTNSSYRVNSDARGTVEIYIVPPRYVLRHLPDAAALVRVSHTRREIELVEVMEEYGGFDEDDQWKEIIILAEKALAT